jgi:uncharacterized membrane protein YhaH (DUF805 family)
MLSNIYSFSGRLGRLAYFGFSILGTIIAGIPLTIGLIAIVKGRQDSDMVLLVVGIMLAVLGLVLLYWSIISLAVKRLHDLDLSGIHAAWIIFGPSLLAAILRTSAPGLEFVAGLLSLGLSLWLLFAPGTEGRNMFG